VENTKTPNFSSESSRTSAYVKSPVNLTFECDKPLQAKTLIPPGLENYSLRAQSFISFCLVIRAIKDISKKQRTTAHKTSIFSAIFTQQTPGKRYSFSRTSMNSVFLNFYIFNLSRKKHFSMDLQNCFGIFGGNISKQPFGTTDVRESINGHSRFTFE
jgi:hypothetical protein